MTPEEEMLFQPPDIQVQRPGFFQGLGQAFFPDQEGIDPTTSQAARGDALLQFGLGTLAASRRPGAGFADSLLAGLGQASQTYQGAVQSAYSNNLKKTELELRQKTADREEKAQARLAKQAEREDKKAEREDSQVRASTATRLAAGIKGAADPVQYLGLVSNVPEVQAAFDEYGIDPTTLNTPEAILAAGDMLGQAGAVGLPYEKPERAAPLQLRAILGPDGKPILVPEQEAVGKTPYERRGTSVTLPDGTVISDGGPSAVSPAELSKPTVNKLQETILSAQDQLDRLNTTAATYKPEYLQARGYLKAGASKVKDFLGADVSPEDREFLKGYTEFRANAARDINSTIRELSGQAVTGNELERALKEAPNDKDGPIEFEAKLKAQTKFVRRAILRANYALKNGIGFKSTEELSKKLPLAAIDGIYDERVNEIFQELGGKPENKAEAYRLANQEFGLVR